MPKDIIKVTSHTSCTDKVYTLSTFESEEITMKQSDMKLFTSSSDQSVTKWLQQFNREREKDHKGEKVMLSVWLKEIDCLLMKEAAIWADQTSQIKSMLKDEYLKKVTQMNVDLFKQLFLE